RRVGDLAWTGPWLAESDGQKGKLYRLRYTIKTPNLATGIPQNVPQTHFLYLQDDDVKKHHIGGDLDHLGGICKVLDKKPLVPEPPPGETPVPSQVPQFVEATTLFEAFARDRAETLRKSANNAAARQMEAREFAKRYQDRHYKVRGEVAAPVQPYLG